MGGGSTSMRIMPDEMRAIAGDLGRLGGEAGYIQQVLVRDWQRLDYGWQSYARQNVDGYFRESMHELQRMALMLEQMEAALRVAADGIEAADRMAANFFEAMDGTPSRTRAVAAPTAGINTAQDLYNEIKNQDELVRIVQIGENEYLVLIKGTQGGVFTENVNNWTSAVVSGLGMPGEYECQVRKLIEQELEPGAVIHFAGHSQGGIIANNLAENQDFAERFEIESVSTFGSPVSAEERKGTDYRRYAVVADPVPFLDPLALNALSPQASTRAYGMVKYYRHLADQTPVLTGVWDPIKAHSSYGEDEFSSLAGRSNPFPLADNSNPFAVDSDYYDLKNVATLDYDALDTTSDAGRVSQIGVSLVLNRYDNLVDSSTWFLPSDWRTEIDRYNDRMNEAIVTATPQVVDSVVDFVGEGVNAVGEGISTVGEGVGGFIGGLLN